VHASGAEEALEQLAAAGLSQVRHARVGGIGTLSRRNGRRREVEESTGIQTGLKSSRLPVQSSSDEAARQEEITPEAASQGAVNRSKPISNANAVVGAAPDEGNGGTTEC